MGEDAVDNFRIHLEKLGQGDNLGGTEELSYQWFMEREEVER